MAEKGGDAVLFTVVDSASPEPPNRARLVRGIDGAWGLASLRFQCASCFGTGLVGLDPCDTCGASGWGLAASRWLDE